MGVNKVIINTPEGERTIVDMTGVTVTPEKLPEGEIAINASGEPIIGIMPKVEQATPSITVSTGGVVVAKATQTAGYVASGTKQATKQLDTLGEQTIIPGTNDVFIPYGRYLTGAQTIKGDTALIPEHIIKGVTIFGVKGTAETGGATSSDLAKQLIERTYTQISDDSVESVGSYVFYDNGFLTSVDLPNAKSIGLHCFEGCRVLSSVSLPQVRTINGGAFRNCTNLTTLVLPSAQTIWNDVFDSSGLTFIDLPAVTEIHNKAFDYSDFLKTIVIRTTRIMCNLDGELKFNVGGLVGNKNILVPSKFLDDYTTDANWSSWFTYDWSIKPLEEYTVDGTVTGEIDMNKLNSAAVEIEIYFEAEDSHLTTTVQDGMTWAEYIESDHNNLGLTTNGENVLLGEYILCEYNDPSCVVGVYDSIYADVDYGFPASMDVILELPVFTEEFELIAVVTTPPDMTWAQYIESENNAGFTTDGTNVFFDAYTIRFVNYDDELVPVGVNDIMTDMYQYIAIE